MLSEALSGLGGYWTSPEGRNKGIVVVKNNVNTRNMAKAVCSCTDSKNVLADPSVENENPPGSNVQDGETFLPLLVFMYCKMCSYIQQGKMVESVSIPAYYVLRW